ncbi:MAG: undecaprenyl-diphosphate phosphatase [Dehalococcoidia bacterium]
MQSVVLALLQGVTEFLPISSSGHLVLGTWLFGWSDQGLDFDAAVHVGTLGSVLVYFRHEWIALGRGIVTGGAVNFATGGARTEDSMAARKVLALIVVGTLPLVIVGLLVRDTLETSFRSPEWVAALLIVTGLGLAAGEYAGRRTRSMSSTGLSHALIIGIAQSFAVLPGISRSGSTMVAGLFMDMTRETAARFSFFLAVPAMLGAGILLVVVEALQDSSAQSSGWGPILVGTGISFITGLAVITLFLRFLRTGSMRPFIAYCLLAGAAILVARAAGF